MAYGHYPTSCRDHHDLVRDFGGKRPTITVLCGSSKFMEHFREQYYALTLVGEIVLTAGPRELHLRKIDLADRVLVINVGGYIDDSTRKEIAYAEKIGKRVEYLEDRYTELRKAIIDQLARDSGSGDTGYTLEAIEEDVIYAAIAVFREQEKK